MDAMQRESSTELDDAPSILSAEQKQVLHQRRSALLSGLIAREQPMRVSSGVAQLIEHRERRHAQHTQALEALIRQAEEAQHTPAEFVRPTAPPESPRRSLPGPPSAQVPTLPQPPTPE